MKVRYTELTGGSGSRGGSVAARNRGGNYWRQRVAPTNPNTSRQGTVRAALGGIAAAYRDVLTAVQRDGWEAYAATITSTDALGQGVNLTGINAYVSGNALRRQAGLTRLDSPPTLNGSAVLTQPATIILTASNVGSDTEVGFVTSVLDSWNATIGGSLLIYVSPARTESQRFFKSGFRFWGSVNRTAGAAVASVSLTTPAPFFLPGGVMKYAFVRAVSVDAQGRASNQFVQRALIESAT